MNELTLLREAGPGASALAPATRSAARAALLDEIAAAGAGRRRVRAPRRRAVLRLGAGLVAVAAAWTTAVVVADPDAAPPRPGSVALVDFALPAFPLTLPEAPPGTTGPTFGGMGSGSGTMHYLGTEDPVDSLHVSVFTEAPPDPSSGSPDVVLEDEVDVDGRTARLAVIRVTGGTEIAYLDLERAPGQYVTVFGQGRFADGDVLVDTAEALVDVPQAVPLQLRLAPAGFSLDFFKEDGRIVRLADDSDPEGMRGLSVHLPLPGEVLTAAQLPGMVEGAAGPVEPVTVHDRPASLVPVEHGEVDRGWYLQAQFPDGTPFVVQAPDTLTREQVLQIAAQVTYTP